MMASVRIRWVTVQYSTTRRLISLTREKRIPCLCHAAKVGSSSALWNHSGIQDERDFDLTMWPHHLVRRKETLEDLTQVIQGSSREVTSCSLLDWNESYGPTQRQRSQGGRVSSPQRRGEPGSRNSIDTQYLCDPQAT